MKYCLFLLSLLAITEYVGQTQYVHQQNFDICEATSINLPFDQANTKVIYWDGHSVRLDTLIVYQDEFEHVVQEVLHEGWLDCYIDINEDQEACLKQVVAWESGESHPEKGIRIEHTVFLPKTIETIYWASGIGLPENKG